jgi:hypothetical protein
VIPDRPFRKMRVIIEDLSTVGMGVESDGCGKDNAE